MIVQLPDHLYFGGLNFNMEYELMNVNLKNGSGLLMSVPVGFSWTVLFFGPLVPLFRGDVKWLFMMLGITVITGGIAAIIFPFIYNKIYIKELMTKGFKPADEYSKGLLKQKGIFIA